MIRRSGRQRRSSATAAHVASTGTQLFHTSWPRSYSAQAGNLEVVAAPSAFGRATTFSCGSAARVNSACP
jgi:hypothetical protein